MNKALELHDSVVQSVAARGDSTVILFTKAYVHASEGDPGVSAGEGFLHEAELIFENASGVPAQVGQLGAISDGYVRIGSERHSLLRLPYHASGEVEVRLQFTSGTSLAFHAQGVRCVVREPGRWLEAYAG